MTTVEVKIDKKLLLIGTGAVAALFVGLIAAPAVVESLAPKPAALDVFESVRSSCGSEGITVSDGGNTLAVDMMGEDEWSGASYNDVECVIGKTQIPSFVKENIWSTNALAGRQTDSYEIVLGGEGTDYAETVFEVEVQWSYHPDNGLDLTFNATEIDGEPSGR